MASGRLLDTFLELVRIDSPTFEERAVAERCAEALTDAGCAVRFDETAGETGSDTGNVIATLQGTAPGATVVLSAHLDTVEPGRGVEPVVRDGVVTSAGETVLGGDDKAGLAAILEVARRLGDGRPHADLRVLLTVAEEVGLVGAKALAEADCSGDWCLVLDAEGAVGGIVEAAPTHYTFTADFTGRAAHAGVAPENGRSALAMAADAIAASRLGRLDAGTTANIGTVHGGTATNVVAAHATVTGECRSLDRARAEGLRAEMDAALRSAAERGGGTVDVRWRREYEGYLHPADDPTVALVEAACRDAGVEPRRYPTGGGSDANVLAAKGLRSVVLASGMTDVHGTGESVRVAELERLVAVVEAALARAVD